jgi:hypothetical protein
MTRFANFQALDITGKTAEFEITEALDFPKPSLRVRPAIGHYNKEFLNAMMRSPLSRFVDGKRAVTKTDSEEADKMAATLREILPGNVVVGWRDVVDDGGAAVEFSPGACRELLEALPDYVIDRIFRFCLEPGNFVSSVPGARPPLTNGQIEAVAGN